MQAIVVGTDFSDESRPALEQAVRVAKHTGGELWLVHALAEDLRDAYLQVRAHLETARVECEHAGVDAHQRIVIGHADTAIPSAADDLGAELVVVGTHGRTGVKRFLMGSVAERVVRGCTTNVMVARDASAGEGGYRRILVPTDFSTGAERALMTAARLGVEDAEIDLFNAWQVPGAVTGYWGPEAESSEVLAPLRSDLRATIDGQARRLIDQYPELRPRIRFVDVEDAPAHAIRKRLERAEYDLVVMGSHGRRGVRRLVLGSVAEVTVRYAPCSVVVVHSGNQSS